MPESRLRRSLRDAPVIRLGTYDYFVHPITDGIPEVDPKLLAEVVDGLAARVPASFDKILTAEAMGIPLAAALADRTGRPYSVARKRAYGLPGEQAVEHRTGYREARLHVHGLKARERILIVDDVVSTGGTLQALHQACRLSGAVVAKSLLVINKDVDLGALAHELGSPAEALVRLRVSEGRVQLLEEPHASARL